jgi:DoxX-like family
MFTAYIVVTVVAAIAMASAATLDFVHSQWVVANMSRLGVPQTWLFSLGALKAAGALGLLVGIAVPPIGVAAAVGLVLFFVGAIMSAVRAHWYTHYYPVPYLLLAGSSLALQLVSL